MEAGKILEAAKRIKALSQTGLLYAEDAYNIDRYKELEGISHDLIALTTGHQMEKIGNFYLEAKEYPTPKTDVRAVVFNERDEILLLLEKDDNSWSLPGGWADIGFSPSEVAVKEVFEETGFDVRPVKLLALLDKRLHAHPAHLEYVYKCFFECVITGGEIKIAHDVLEVAFFQKEAIPPLSEKRVTASQIRLMFEFREDPGKRAVFD